MRAHGWGGSPPAGDEEAVARIKEATHRCVREPGGAIAIAHVAARLGGSRQTVYRYFPSTDALLIAAALDGLPRSVTSDTARAIGRSLPDQTAVDWEARGLGPDLRNELIEWTLRVVQSLLLDPGDATRSSAELRDFLRRWIAPGAAAVSASASAGGEAPRAAS